MLRHLLNLTLLIALTLASASSSAQTGSSTSDLPASPELRALQVELRECPRGPSEAREECVCDAYSRHVVRLLRVVPTVRTAAREWQATAQRYRGQRDAARDERRAERERAEHLEARLSEIEGRWHPWRAGALGVCLTGAAGAGVSLATRGSAAASISLIGTAALGCVVAIWW
jgi:hypothetical protein